MANKLIVSAAPHITSADSTSKIMGRVCIALLPTLIASVLIFGFQALLLTAVTVAACVVFEYAYCKLVGRDVTISDLSAGLQPARRSAGVDVPGGRVYRHRDHQAALRRPGL